MMSDDEVTDSSGDVFADLGIDKREAVMRRWDKWRAHIKSGGGASWPRDEFEALLDSHDDEIAKLKAELQEAREIIAYFLLWLDSASKMGPADTIDDLRYRACTFLAGNSS